MSTGDEHRTSRSALRVLPLALAAGLPLASACGGSATRDHGPTAVGRADREVGPAPLLACFDAAGTRDAEGQATRIAWDFGDGSAPSGEPATCHLYAEPGSYAASLVATDAEGRSAMAVVVVTATTP